MPFSFCKRCMDMRQFLPNGYDDLPRHCDVCGAEEVNNFVAQETERFGKAKGGSLDHFYDKIFEALETDEERDTFKEVNSKWWDSQRRIEALRRGASDKIANSWIDRGHTIDEFGSNSSRALVWLLDNSKVYQWAIDNGLLEDRIDELKVTRNPNP